MLLNFLSLFYYVIRHRSGTNILSFTQLFVAYSAVEGSVICVFVCCINMIEFAFSRLWPVYVTLSF